MWEGRVKGGMERGMVGGREERRNGIDMERWHIRTLLSFLFKCDDKAEEEAGGAT